MNNLTNDCGKIIQPNNLKIDLMEHQKTTLWTMLNLEEKGYIDIYNFKCFSNVPQNIRLDTQIGILGDKVGSGKSLMIITLFLLNKNIINRQEYYESSKYVNIKLLDNSMQEVKSNLLIVPDNLLSQWIKFFDYAPSIKIITIEQPILQENTFLKKILEFDVIILPSTKVDPFFLKTENIKWNRIIIDEADTIKLPKMLELNGKFIWLMTGTPTGLVYNNRPYVNNIFKKNKNWIIDYITVKNNDNFIDESLKLPVPMRITIKCDTPNEIKIIKDFIPQHIMNMINAGNTDEAIKLLNCNEDTNDNILKVLTRNIHEAIKNKTIELEAEKNKKYHGVLQFEQEKKIEKLKKIISRLNMRCDSIKKKIAEMNDEYCPICLDNIEKPVILGCCKNIYCFECLTMTISNLNKCPNCKKIINKKDIHVVNKNKTKTSTASKDREKKVELKNKMDMLMDILSKNKEKKYLIFANYVETFDKIEKKLCEHKINYGILKGNIKTEEIIDKFKNGKITVIMLNAQNYGAGLNLQMATDVIIYHRFQKELEEQVIGRAQRIGRKDQLKIYYLLYDNENEIMDNTEKYQDIDYNKYLEME